MEKQDKTQNTGTNTGIHISGKTDKHHMRKKRIHLGKSSYSTITIVGMILLILVVIAIVLITTFGA